MAIISVLLFFGSLPENNRSYLYLYYYAIKMVGALGKYRIFTYIC